MVSNDSAQMMTQKLEWIKKCQLSWLVSLYFACNVRNAFSTSEVHKNYTLWTCQKVCEALTFLLNNIYIRFGTKLLDNLWVFRWVRITHPL